MILPGRVLLPLLCSVLGGLGRHLSPRQGYTLEDTTAPGGERSLAAPQPNTVFEVAVPVLGPNGPLHSTAWGNDELRNACSVLLMEHVFAWSYEQPFIGLYEPPDCDFNRVVINFTVTSEGRQFDRLALMYFGDTEVWRTSTAEPSPHPGIIWTYWKDMTEYLSLWRSPQKLIFDLGNLVDDTYTGTFNTTLTAVFFRSDLAAETGRSPADQIIPISARQSWNDSVSAWNYPEQLATVKSEFPRNANRAVFTVSANGQLGEEFWWANSMQSDSLAFEPTVGVMPGMSPYREVQVLIDGELAGVAWPYPVVFTGGYSPTMHRPIVGVHAFDLREYEIDITAWLPVLSDGRHHEFEIRVMGVDDDGEGKAWLAPIPLDGYWVVTGKVFLWLDEEDCVTTGEHPTVTSGATEIMYSSATAQNETGFNETLRFDVLVNRRIEIKGSVKSRHRSDEVTWTQEMSFNQSGIVAFYGNGQGDRLMLQGVDTASTPSGTYYESEYQYPVYLEYYFLPGEEEADFTMDAVLDQGLRQRTSGLAVFPLGTEAYPDSVDSPPGSASSLVDTIRRAAGGFRRFNGGRNATGYGFTNQVYQVMARDESDEANPIETQLYYRNVTAQNDVVVGDDETLSLEEPGRQFVLRTGLKAAVTDFAPIDRASFRIPSRGRNSGDHRVPVSETAGAGPKDIRNLLAGDW